MTDIEKVQIILEATNQGADLKKHQLHIVTSVMNEGLGNATRLIFDDLWEKYANKKSVTDYQ